MGAWIKFFKDGPSEHGSDIDINNGKASWSRGRLNNITFVQLFEDRTCLNMNVPNTSWHQYDRFVAPLGEYGKNVSARIARVVQAEIKSCHVGLSAQYICINHTAFINLQDSSDGRVITSKDIGLWITGYILYNGETGLEICEKGAFNGDKFILK